MMGFLRWYWDNWRPLDTAIFGLIGAGFAAVIALEILRIWIDQQ